MKTKQESRCGHSRYSHQRRWVVLCLLLITVTGGGCVSEYKQRPTRASIGSETNRLPFPGPHRYGQVADDPNLPVTVVSYPEYRDPLTDLNRITFAFNDIAYRFLLIPVAKGYTRTMPDPVERSMGNFFYNIKTPVFAVNHLLQFKFKPLERNLLRFGINSTIGIVGLFDPAYTCFDLEREETHFEDTLAHYGAGYGFYVVLPLAGPSDVRNGVSTIVEYFLNSIPYLTENPETTIIQLFDYLQDFAPKAEVYDALREKSKDPYLFYRNLYLQGVQRDVDY